ncbi:hypothetical protein KRMM14A1004_52000 [Krasilnikovia sp. MM14-A1004]
MRVYPRPGVISRGPAATAAAPATKRRRLTGNENLEDSDIHRWNLPSVTSQGTVFAPLNVRLGKAGYLAESGWSRTGSAMISHR